MRVRAPMSLAHVGLTAGLVLQSLLTAALASPQTSPAEPTVEQPRAYGHVLGDVLTQRMSLDSTAGTDEVPVLPPAVRVNAWFDRLPPRIETDQRGNHWLRLDYQIINVTRDLQMGTLPALTLSTKSGRTLTVPEWPVSIGPLTPDLVFAKGDLQSMRPDHPAIPYPTETAWYRFKLGAGLLGLTLLSWLGWFLWRNARDTTQLPFARAARTLRRLGSGGASESSEAWVALHRAFNAAAGHVVQPDSLPELFDRAPYLAPLRTDIERFFAVSSERFFAIAPSSTTFLLGRFSHQLRRAEKQCDVRHAV